MRMRGVTWLRTRGMREHACDCRQVAQSTRNECRRRKLPASFVRGEAKVRGPRRLNRSRFRRSIFFFLRAGGAKSPGLPTLELRRLAIATERGDACTFVRTYVHTYEELCTRGGETQQDNSNSIRTMRKPFLFVIRFLVSTTWLPSDLYVFAFIHTYIRTYVRTHGTFAHTF